MTDEPKLFSLAEIVEISRSDRRAVQFWVETGALKPTTGTDRQGRGVHRRFDRTELLITCVLSACATVSLPIGRMIKIANAFREHYLNNEARKHIDASINGSEHVFLVIEPGFTLTLLANPTEREAYKHLVQDILAFGRGESTKTIIYLNPWLKDVPG